MNTKNKAQRLALFKTLFVLLIMGGAIVAFMLWAAYAKDSELAQSIRRVVGIAEPQGQEVVPATAEPPEPVVVEAHEPPKPEPVKLGEPIVMPKITFKEIAAQRQFWPKSLTLKLAVRVPIRYNGKDYGVMEFPRGRTIQVDGLSAGGEIFCWIDGNYLSLSVYETDFYGWFKEKYSDRYDVQPVVVDMGTKATSRYRLGTEKGEAAFWAEMRIWCYQNYDSVTLDVEEDNLVFLWEPKEDAPIDFEVEAREIARQFLLKRAKYGSRENYAACEIRDPVSRELLGASSIFIPRL